MSPLFNPQSIFFILQKKKFFIPKKCIKPAKSCIFENNAKISNYLHFLGSIKYFFANESKFGTFIHILSDSQIYKVAV